jgi:uncharacterized RDD family membrane protein YckC/ribosomal protein L40E
VPAMNGTLFCTKCGAPNPASAAFCSRCGAANGPAAPAATVGVPAGGYAPVAAYPAIQSSGRYGGFWIRVVAAIIDAILIRVVLFPIGAIFGLSSLALGGIRHSAFPFMHFFGGGVMLMLSIAASWLYEAVMESSSYQATLGKMIFGMKVTDLYGNRISFARATGRHFAKILSAMILCIGFIMVGLTERKQGLHDLIAGTLVQRS